MGAALIIMVREGFEGALVVAIVFAYLRKLERMDLAMPVWLGVLSAAGVAIGVGIVVHLTVGKLEGAARMRAFAAISGVAVVVLTWMVFWMRRQSRLIRSDLEQRVDAALGSVNVGRARAGVALVAVLREGIEASLFLLAAATESSGTSVVVGGLLGLVLASVLAYLVYWGGRSLPMRSFFKITGMVLIVFAAGLAARTVLFLQTGGDLGSLNLNGVFDVRSVSVLTQDREVGRFLAAMFGWDPRPSIEQVVAWLGYLLPVTYLFLRRTPPASNASRPGAVRTLARQ
jgi:high-affinity iron transporter